MTLNTDTNGPRPRPRIDPSFLARDAFVRTNRRAIAMIVRL